MTVPMTFLCENATDNSDIQPEKVAMLRTVSD